MEPTTAACGTTREEFRQAIKAAFSSKDIKRVLRKKKTIKAAVQLPSQGRGFMELSYSCKDTGRKKSEFIRMTFIRPMSETVYYFQLLEILDE